MRRNTAGFMLTVALSLMITMSSPAFAENSIMVDRAGNAIIQTGQSINITITTEQPATGTLTVFSPDKTTSWSIPISQPVGQHKYVFPDDFPTGANTTVFGPYNVSATMQMMVGTRVWNAEFRVGFFTVPDLLFGTIMAAVASFAAFGLMKTSKLTSPYYGQTNRLIDKKKIQEHRANRFRRLSNHSSNKNCQHNNHELLEKKNRTYRTP